MNVERHPPEHGRPAAPPGVAPAGCCCCCLHTVGGLLGAAVATLRSQPGDDDSGAARVARVFWWSVAGLLAVTLLLWIGLSGMDGGALMTRGLLILLLVAPLAILAAWCAAFLVALTDGWRAVGRALYLFVGVVIGGLAGWASFILLANVGLSYGWW